MYPDRYGKNDREGQPNRGNGTNNADPVASNDSLLARGNNDNDGVPVAQQRHLLQQPVQDQHRLHRHIHRHPSQQMNESNIGGEGGGEGSDKVDEFNLPDDYGDDNLADVASRPLSGTEAGGRARHTEDNNRSEQQFQQQEQHHQHQQNQEGFVLSVLLDNLKKIAMEAGYDAAEAVSIVKAKNILEATDHDVTLAAELYWDDFLATSQQQQQNLQQQRYSRVQLPPPPPPQPHLAPPPPPAIPPYGVNGPFRLRASQNAMDYSLERETAQPQPLHQLQAFLLSRDQQLDAKQSSEKHKHVPPKHSKVKAGSSFSAGTSNVAETIMGRRLEHSFDQQCPEGDKGEPMSNSKQMDEDTKPHVPDKDNSRGTKRRRKPQANQSTARYRLNDNMGKTHRRGSSSSFTSSEWSEKGEGPCEDEQLKDTSRARDNRSLETLGHALNPEQADNDAMNPGPVNEDNQHRPFDNLNDEGNDFAEVRAAIVAAVDADVAANANAANQEPSASVSDDEAAAALMLHTKGARPGMRLSSSSTSSKRFKGMSKLCQTTANKFHGGKFDIKSIEGEDADCGRESLNSDKTSSQLRHKNNYVYDNEEKKSDCHGRQSLADAEDDDGYLSENDWLWDSTEVSKTTSPSYPPLDILWGGITATDLKLVASPPQYMQHRQKGLAKSTLSDRTTPLIHTLANKKINDHTEHNMIAVDDENQNEILKTTTNSTEQQSNDEVLEGIPYTWLNASFQFTEDDSTFGLVLHPPNDHDMAYNEWEASPLWRGNTRNGIPPPYHCRSISALLSIVNSLLYTGVCIPVNGGSSIVSSTSRPLVDVTKDLDQVKKDQMKKIQEQATASNRTKSRKEKLKEDELNRNAITRKTPSKRELEGRLADALTSLLSIAIRASIERKLKVLEVLKDTNDQVLKRKVVQMRKTVQHLCPTAWWDDENHNHGSRRNIVVSYTNIDEIRSYILGNLQAFMSSGGCALFMETILLIHGKGAVLSMIRKARENDLCKPQLSQDDQTTGDVSMKPDARLVWCTCGIRHKQAIESNSIAQRPRNVVYDTTPLSHECISIEMISLLLTGKVYSTLKGWSTAPLGVGLLSNIPGEIGKGLTRPEKPVWILRGPTCYSTLWLNGCNDNIDSFSRIDDPLGSVASLSHWNSWYNVRHLTKLRLVTNRTFQANNVPRPLSTNFDDILHRAQHMVKSYQQDFGILQQSRSVQKDQSKASSVNVVRMIAQRRRDAILMAKDITLIENIDPYLFVSDDEVNSVLAHPDDAKFYPFDYRLWRYCLNLKSKVDNMSDSNVTNDRVGGYVTNSVANAGYVKEITSSQNGPFSSTSNWRAYHRLTEREQLIVETKLGPAINTILWTRWPRATVDKYEPQHPPAVV